MRSVRHTYRMELNDGHKIEIIAENAAQAVEEARWRHRTYTVTSCHIGVTAEEARYIQGAVPGAVFFEVPPHESIAHDIVRPPQYWRRDGHETEPMFDETEIVAESAAAKEKRNATTNR